MRPNCLTRGAVAAVTVLLILAVSVPSALAQARAARKAPRGAAAGTLRVETFLPQGVVASESGVQVVVRFSSDVVKPSSLSTTRTAEGVVQFDPSLEGYAIWESPRLLRFTPRTPLRRSTRYVARISPRVADLAGQPLQGPVEFQFNTQPLTLLKAEQAGFTPERRAIVEFQFSDFVVPTDLAKYLTISSDGKRLGWRLESDVKSARPRIVTDPILTSSLAMRLEPGLPAASGPLGLSATVARVIPLKFRLQVEQLSARWSQDKVSLVLRFSNAVKLENIQQFISVDPPVSFEVNDDFSRLVLIGDFRPEHRYTVRVRAGLAGTLQQLLLEDAELSVWVPPMKPFLEMKEAGGHLSTRGSMKLRVRSAGIKEFRVAGTRVYDNNLVYFAARVGGDYFAVDLGHTSATKTVPVTPASAPGAVTTEVDLRDVLGKEASGLWAVKVSADRPAGVSQGGDDEDSYYGSTVGDSAVLAISNLGIVGKRAPGELTVWVAALDTAQPLAGVKVRAFSRKNQLLKEAETGADGIVRITGLADGADGQPGFVIASQGDEISYLDLSENLAGRMEFLTEGREFVSDGYEAFLTSERGAYRPGEKAHLFGYVRDRDVAAPKSGFPLEMQVERPDGKRLEPVPVQAGDTGAVARDLAIPSYAPTGLYKVRLQLPGAGKKTNGD